MLDFFEELAPQRRKMEIIDKISSIPSSYIGGKRRLLPYIMDILDSHNVQCDSVFDAFSGSAMVSLLFRLMGKKVYCNDLLTSSTITALCLLNSKIIPLSDQDLSSLCNTKSKKNGHFVLDNYKDKFFTEDECIFLDCYRQNISELSGGKFLWGMELINKATLSSIPNSNFSIYGKDLKALRSTHDLTKSFWDEKWRDTTRKRRDGNNEIMFKKSLNEMYSKYALAGVINRLPEKENVCVFNSDIIGLLETETIEADMIYLDPPYGGPSSDYALLYRFLEEYLYGCKLEEMEHIQKGGKRFSKKANYQDQFEKLLSLCGKFKTWLISYNESSYANIDAIRSTIKNAGRSNIEICNVPITYQYRKGKSAVDVKHFKKNYNEEGHKYLQRGTEYLILVR